MIDLILSRHSIRKFTAEPVSGEHIDTILETGRWAPSGLNNQPWRFAVIQDKNLMAHMAPLTHYSQIILAAPLLIAVFYDPEAGYDRTKDMQGMGACIENMLLAAHALGLGAVWLGQILKNGPQVAKLLNAPQDFELMAVLAIGHPGQQAKATTRKPLDELVFFRG